MRHARTQSPRSAIPERSEAPGESLRASFSPPFSGPSCAPIGGVGRALSYLDTLEVPIIENTPNEEDLKDSMAEAMKQYPDAAGVLVRRHGVYVWG